MHDSHHCICQGGTSCPNQWSRSSRRLTIWLIESRCVWNKSVAVFATSGSRRMRMPSFCTDESARITASNWPNKSRRKSPVVRSCRTRLKWSDAIRDVPTKEVSAMVQSTMTIAQQIAQAASAFEQQRTGHAPTAVTVILSEDTLVITLRGGL